MFSGFSIPNPATVPLYLRGFGRSIADKGLIFDGVPVWLLPGVEGESPPIRDTRAPDRGVIFPLSFEVAGDRKSSLREMDAALGSGRRARRGGLTGDEIFGPASLGVNGLFEFRKAVLNVGVKGLAGVPLFCLSRGMVGQGVSGKSAGWAK